MGSHTILCDRCDCEIEHVCNNDLRQAVKKLFAFVPECGFPKELSHNLSEEERTKDTRGSRPIDRMSFFTEAYLYPLLGKEDARSVLAYVNSVIRAAGIEPRALQEEVWREQDAKEKAEAIRLKKVEERRLEILEARRPLSIERSEKTEHDIWKYEDARGWDEAIYYGCEEKGHKVVATRNNSLAMGRCVQCKVHFQLPLETFRERFVKVDRTPVSNVSTRIVAAIKRAQEAL